MSIKEEILNALDQIIEELEKGTGKYISPETRERLK